MKNLVIPEKLLDLFPPRAMGYGRSRESFNSKNGVAFDPFGAVETASGMTLKFLFHSQRASRLVQHKSLDDSQLGLVEVIDEVVKNSFKKQYKNSYHQELQNVVNAQVLNQLFGLGADANNYPQVTAIVNAKLNEIESWLRSAKSNEMQKIVNTQFVKNIQKFKKNPSNYKRIDAPKIPDGSPIGME